MGYENEILDYDLKIKDLHHIQEFIKMDEIPYSPVQPEDIVLDEEHKVNFVQINEWIGRFSNDVDKWASILAKFLDGEIEFKGEESNDFWKIKFQGSQFEIFNGTITFSDIPIGKDEYWWKCELKEELK